MYNDKQESLYTKIEEEAAKEKINNTEPCETLQDNDKLYKGKDKKGKEYIIYLIYYKNKTLYFEKGIKTDEI